MRPVGSRQYGDGDLRKIRAALSVKAVIQHVRENGSRCVGRVPVQFAVGQRLRSGHRPAGNPVLASVVADAMLYARYLRRVPLPDEDVQYSAVAGEVPVEVAATLPRADRGQMRRLERGDLPLVNCVVRDAKQADLAGAPPLRRGPLDAVVVVERLPCREDVQVTR